MSDENGPGFSMYYGIEYNVYVENGMVVFSAASPEEGPICRLAMSPDIANQLAARMLNAATEVTNA